MFKKLAYFLLGFCFFLFAVGLLLQSLISVCHCSENGGCSGCYVGDVDLNGVVFALVYIGFVATMLCAAFVTPGLLLLHKFIGRDAGGPKRF